MHVKRSRFNKRVFSIFDEDRSGTIDKEEFGALYDVVKEQTEKEVMEKVAAERAAVSRKRKAREGAGDGEGGKGKRDTQHGGDKINFSLPPNSIFSLKKNM